MKKVINDDDELPILKNLPTPLWHHMPKNERQEKGYHPNYIATNDRDRIVAITCWLSNPDWSLNKLALDRSVELFGWKVIIRLMDGTGKNLMAQALASEVAQNLRGVEPTNGIHGPFYWINIDFKPANGFKGPM